MKSKLAVVILLYAGLAGVSISGLQIMVSQSQEVAGGVDGSAYARFDPDNAEDSTIALPDINVFVRNMETGSVSQEVMTGVNGRYQIEGLGPGRFQLCWKAAGWVSDCNADPIVLSVGSEYQREYQEIGIAPHLQPDAEETGRAVITGRVRLADGSACEYSNSLFEVGQSALVSALDNTGHVVRGPVRANSAGEYVLAGVPQRDIRVHATCGNAGVEAPVSALQLASGTVTQLGLTIDNSRPEFVAMTAELEGQTVKSVLPGTTVELAAEAQGRDAGHLQYRWATASGFGSIVSTGGNRAQWTAPFESASNQIHVLISDGRGGFTQGSIIMRVGQHELGMADPPPPAYAEQVVTNGMDPNQEYIPPYGGYVKGRNESNFLTERTNDEATAADYYTMIVTDANGEYDPDPTKCKAKRCTLGGWFMANGWNNDGTPKNGKEARTVFLNNNDLGYVRDMHCLSKDIDPGLVSESVVACWVTNYSGPNQEVTDLKKFPPQPDATRIQPDLRAAENRDVTKAQASVNMEYREFTINGQKKQLVTFIAYGNPVDGQLGAAKIVPGSDQDGFGDKPVPGMCNNCHGGRNFTSANVRNKNPDIGGNFIVFDLSTFIFSKDPKWTRTDLEPAFQQQNMAVFATTPRTAVRELIDGWYKDYGATKKANDAFIPAGWQKQDADKLKPLTSEKLYLNVVRTCRTCHTALQNQRLSWSTYAGFNAKRGGGAGIANLVCEPPANRVMPHNAISYLNFWRFLPPSLPDYPMGGPGAPASTKMMQPFMDMGAFLDANKKGSNGACENSKGRPK